jgi:hypothetical protein
MAKGSFSQGDGKLHKPEKPLLQFQGIRSPNSLEILCWASSQTDNSLRSNNLFEKIAQSFQRKGLLIPFHRRIRFSGLRNLPVHEGKYGSGTLIINI